MKLRLLVRSPLDALLSTHLRLTIPSPFAYGVTVALRADSAQLLVTGCRDTAPLSNCDMAIYDTHSGKAIATKSPPRDTSPSWDTESFAVWTGASHRKLWDPASGALADEKNAIEVAAVRRRAGQTAVAACAPPPELALGDMGIERVDAKAGRELVVPLFRRLETRALHRSPFGEQVLLEVTSTLGGHAVGESLLFLEPWREPPAVLSSESRGNASGWQWLAQGIATVHASPTAGASAGFRLSQWSYDGVRSKDSALPEWGNLTPDGRWLVTWSAATVSVQAASDRSPVCTVNPISLVERLYPTPPAPDSYRSWRVARAELSEDGEAVVVGVYTDEPRAGEGHLLRYRTRACQLEWGPVALGVAGSPFEWVISADGEVHLEHGIITVAGSLDSRPYGQHSVLESGEAAVAYGTEPRGAVVRFGRAWHDLESTGLPKEPAAAVGVSADGRFGVGTDGTALVVWGVAGGSVRWRAKAEAATRAVTVIHSGGVVISATDDDVTWTAMETGARLHLRVFAPRDAGAPPRALIEASDGRIDGDDEVVAAVQYATADGPRTIREIPGRTGGGHAREGSRAHGSRSSARTWTTRVRRLGLGRPRIASNVRRLRRAALRVSESRRGSSRP